VLPPFDLSAVEHGMQQFLEQLGQTGSPFAGHRDGTWLCLGVVLVAGAAAATACEIGRRQLSQRSEIRDQRSGTPLLISDL
jgi:hypothetical protein